jgi:hypothetical protein
LAVQALDRHSITIERGNGPREGHKHDNCWDLHPEKKSESGYTQYARLSEAAIAKVWAGFTPSKSNLLYHLSQKLSLRPILFVAKSSYWGSRPLLCLSIVCCLLSVVRFVWSCLYVSCITVASLTVGSRSPGELLSVFQ